MVLGDLNEVLVLGPAAAQSSSKPPLDGLGAGAEGFEGATPPSEGEDEAMDPERPVAGPVVRPPL